MPGPADRGRRGEVEACPDGGQVQLANCPLYRDDPGTARLAVTDRNGLNPCHGLHPTKDGDHAHGSNMVQRQGVVTSWKEGIWKRCRLGRGSLPFAEFRGRPQSVNKGRQITKSHATDRNRYKPLVQGESPIDAKYWQDHPY